jgi:small-conductance mechanosensitive channel
MKGNTNHNRQRHSGESRNPAALRAAHRKSDAWIPAFAGMTLLVLMMLLSPIPAFAQNPEVAKKVEQALNKADVKPTEQQIKELVDTLEDPTAREGLITKLKTLQAVKEEKKAEPQSVEALDAVGKAMSDAGMTFSSILRSFGDIPQASRWFERQLQTPESRAGWLNILLQGSLSLLAGYIAFFILRWITARPRHILAQMPGETLSSKLIAFFGYHLLALLPVIAFASAMLFTLGIFDNIPEKSHRAIVAFFNAFIVMQVFLWLMQMIFAERVPRLRFLPLADESAAYLFVWSARLGAVIIFGYFLSQAALIVDVPEGSVHAFAALIGLMITLMVIVIVLQNRANVSGWLRGKPKPEEEAAPPKKHDVWRAGREWLAKTWHVLAIIYLCVGFIIAALDVQQGFATLLRATVVTVVTFVLFRLLLGMIDELVDRGFALPEELKKQFPMLEERTNSYLPIFERVVKGIAWIIGILIVLSAWGLNTSAWFATPMGKGVVSSAISILVTLFVVIVLWELISNLVDRYLQAQGPGGVTIQRSARMRTLLPLVRYLLHTLLVVTGGIFILSQLGLDVTPLLAGAGIIGLAVGFGAQTLVKDVITGLFILLEDTVAVGDVVDVGNGHSGAVEIITIRALRLRDVNGHVHAVPFSEVTSIINMTKHFATVLIEIGVSYNADIPQVMKVMNDVTEEMRQDQAWRYFIHDSMEMFGVERFDASSIALRARIKTDASKQWAVKREYLFRLKKAFDAQGIEIPYPISVQYQRIDDKDVGLLLAGSKKSPAAPSAPKSDAPMGDETN